MYFYKPTAPTQHLPFSPFVSHMRPLTTYSSTLDFPALFDQKCDSTGNNLCNDAWSCQSSLRSSLSQRFGSSISPANGVSGSLSASCAWIPFDMPEFTILTQANWQGNMYLNVPDDKCNAKGYCALTSSANPRYVPGTCTSIAGTSVTNGNKKAPVMQGVNTYNKNGKPPVKPNSYYVPQYDQVNPPKPDNPVSTYIDLHGKAYFQGASPF